MDENKKDLKSLPRRISSHAHFGHNGEVSIQRLTDEVHPNMALRLVHTYKGFSKLDAKTSNEQWFRIIVSS
eukprot:scaffold12605_cov93-Skeletonema_marinoi.AAC.3